MAATPSTATPQSIYSDSDGDRDSQTEGTPTITTATNRHKKRPRGRTDSVWLYARQPITGVEPLRALSGKEWRRLWYCNRPGPFCEKYAVLNVATARGHMLKEHGILCDSEAPRKRMEPDLRSIFSEQELTNKYNEDKRTQEVLRSCVDKQTVHQALLRLIVYYDLPLSMVE